MFPLFDVSQLIPDQSDDIWNSIPPDPDEEMDDRERERLDEELYRLIDSGAFAE